MDILLINPYNEESCGINETTVEVPAGLLSIASFLENKGMKVGLLDAYAMQLPQEKVILEVIKEKPRAVGISVNIFSFLQAVSYTREIKKISADTVIIWGGPHSTIAPEICLSKSEADILVMGEGELTAVEVLNGILSKHSYMGLEGIAYRQNGGIKINPPRERIIDLDGLPFPAYHLLPDLRHYKCRARKTPFMGIVTSRGCPFSCIYCSKDVFKNKITMRTPENIIEEIDFLVNKYGIKQIDILDDNFTVDPRRIDLLCDLIIKRPYKICISLQLGIRADRVDEPLMKKMARAGVFKVAFGVESGNKNILKEIKKQLDLDKVLLASRLARKYGMVVVGFFMIGLPGDTESSLQDTIDFAIKMNPHIANFMMTIPFYGTELYRRVEGEGRFIFDTKYGISHGFYATKAFYEIGNLTQDLMVRYYKKAYRDFYFRFSKIIDLLGSVRSFDELKWIMQTGFNTLFPREGHRRKA